MSKEHRFQFLAHPNAGKVSALWLDPGRSIAAIVMAHGAGAGMTHTNMQNIAMALADQRVATFRYQFPFMERGGGRDSQQVTLSTIEHAVRFAAGLTDVPLFAGGHSFGGRMTSLAAAEGKLNDVRGLALYAFPLHPPAKPSAKRAEHFERIKLPVLFVSGTRDKMMSRDLLDTAIAAINAPVEICELATADHGYKILKRTRTSQRSVFEELALATRNWIERILD